MKRIIIILIAAAAWANAPFAPTDTPLEPLFSEGTAGAQTLPAETRYLDATNLLWYFSSDHKHDTIKATASGWTTKTTQSLETGDGNLSLFVKAIHATPAACSLYVLFQRSDDNSHFLRQSDSLLGLINDTLEHMYDVPLPNLYSNWVQLYFVVDSSSAFQAHVGKR